MSISASPLTEKTPSPTHKIFNIKPFVLFSAVMIFKSYIAWMTIFDSAFPWEPLVKEVPFIMILFCLIEKFSTKHKLAWYWAANLLFSSIFVSIILYYKHFGIIPTYHAITQIGQVGEVKNSVFYLFDPYYYLIFLDLIVMFIWLLRKRKTPQFEQINSKRLGTVKVATIFVVSIAITILNIIPNQASVNELKKTEKMGILGYEAYAMLNNQNKEEDLIPTSDITQEKINALKNITTVNEPALWGAAQGKNIIIIQLESFQNFLINLKVDGQEITPTLNELANNNFYFSNFDHQVGRGNTSDAEFVVNTSLYVDSIEPASHEYTSKNLPSLPKLLRENGYFTSTFHTNTVAFWNRLALYTSLGFDKYYDDTFFGESDIVSFASSDEVLYDKTADELKKLDDGDKPFYAQVISMSAHHPFIIPEDKMLINLSDKYQDNLVGNYLVSQHYADYALGQFIQKLKASGVWDNSLIIIYGDHHGLSLTSLHADENKLMEEVLGHPYRQVDMLNIPLIIASKGITSPKEYKNLGGQIDILPTIANLTGISLENFLHFGQDLFNYQTTNILPERYYLPTGSFLNSDGLFIPGIDFADGTLQPGDFDNKVVTVTLHEYENNLQLLHLSDSYIYQLPDINVK